ncbi:MAG: hypothetical protein LC107_06625 [Chitinophagales bacterium]|nr:hypothetical protein [Chitinophagales bacterium]
MKHKNRTRVVVIVSCLFSLFSYIYVNQNAPKISPDIEYTVSLDKSIHEQRYMPEVQFVCKVFKTIFEVANFR